MKYIRSLNKLPCWVFIGFNFLLFTVVLSLRIMAENTHYISPDSEHYLFVASNILQGKGPYIPSTFPFTIQACQHLKYFSDWPLGYPWAIVAVAWLTGTSVLISSKILSLILWILIVGTLYKCVHPKVGLYFSFAFFAYPFLEVFSYSWSEPLFILLSLWIILFINNLEKSFSKPVSLRLFVLNIYILALLVLSLTLVRYVGILGLVLLGFWAIYKLFSREYILAILYILALLIASICIGLYLYNNFYHTGYYTGSERIAPKMETMQSYLELTAQGIFNLPWVLRYFYFSDGFEFWWFAIGAGIQCIIMFIWYKGIQKIKIESETLSQIHLYMTIGTVYFLFVAFLRAWMPFDPLNYRILFPGMVLWLLSTCLILLKVDYKPNKGEWILGGLFWFSALCNLPKEYLLQWTNP